jgi:hypothetical protein
MVPDVEAAAEAAIRGAALCTICIAQKTGVAPISVLSVLANVGQRVKITDEVTQCDGCLQVKNTHRV